MPSVAPQLRAALVTRMQADPTFANVSVRYGSGLTDAQKVDSVMVGTPNPYDDSGSLVLTASQEWGPLGQYRRKEEGDLWCATLSWNGNTGEAGVQQSFETAFALAALVETFLRNDPTVGLPALQMEAEFGRDSNVLEYNDADTGGPVCVLAFSIHYKARI